MSQSENSHSKTILLVEDESSVRFLVKSVLLTDGYDVIDVGRASAALKIEDPVDLLIVNFYLPEMRGHELAAHIVKKYPKLPVIIISGGEIDIARINESFPFRWKFLSKPFGRNELLSVVHDVLDKSGA